MKTKSLAVALRPFASGPNSSFHRGKSRSGFTLIECLLATVILGIGVIGVAGMFACASLSERKAANLAQARQITEETLETVRSGGYDLSSQPSGSHSVPTPGLPRGTGVLAWQPYAAGTEGKLTLVAINLNWAWPNSSGHYTTVTLVSGKNGS